MARGKGGGRAQRGQQKAEVRPGSSDLPAQQLHVSATVLQAQPLQNA